MATSHDELSYARSGSGHAWQFWFGVYAVMSIAIVVPIFGEQIYFLSHENLSVPLRLVEMQSAIQSGQWPPVVLPNLVEGLGSGWFVFYPPLSYWFTYGIFAAGASVLTAIKLAYIAMFFMSGVAMYACLSRTRYSTVAAGLGGALYLSAPYHLIDLYVRNAYAETFAFIWVPVIFLGLWEMLKGDGRRSWILGLGLAGAFLTHSITAFYGLVFAALFGIALLCRDIQIIRRPGLWRNITVAAVLTSLLVAFYALPFIEHARTGVYAAFEPSLRDDFEINPENMYEKAMLPEKLLRLDLPLGHDLYGARGYGHTGPQMPYNLGLHLIVLAAGGVWFGRRRAETWMFSSLLTLAVFATTPWMPWDKLPDVFSVIQFPFRLLLFASFFSVLLAAVAIACVVTARPTWSKALVGIVLLALTGYLMLALATVTPRKLERDAWLAPDLNHRLGTTGGGEHFPTTFRQLFFANDMRIDLSLKTPQVLAENAAISSYDGSGTKHTFEVTGAIAGHSVRVQLPALYYLGYRLVNERGEAQRVVPCSNGLICSEIPPGHYILQYGATRWSVVANCLSALGVLSLIIMARSSFANRRSPLNQRIGNSIARR